MKDADLADYESAYAHVERRLQIERDWGAVEALVRRRLRRPLWRLCWTVFFIVFAAGASFFGVGNGWMVALGLSMVVLPRRIKALRNHQERLAGVESGEDVRVLVKREADDHFARAISRFFLNGLLGVSFIVVGLIAWWVGKSPWPGVLAGAVLFAWCAVLLGIIAPRAARESRLFADEDERDEDDDE